MRINYTKDDLGLSFKADLDADPQGRKGTVEIVQGKGIKISSPDGSVFLFVKGNVQWDVLTEPLWGRTLQEGVGKVDMDAPKEPI